MLSRLFDIFDNGDGVVDRKLFFSGLTILCDGERDSKIFAAFDLHDEDADGFISLEQARWCAVTRVTCYVGTMLYHKVIIIISYFLLVIGTDDYLHECCVPCHCRVITRSVSEQRSVTVGIGSSDSTPMFSRKRDSSQWHP